MHILCGYDTDTVNGLIASAIAIACKGNNNTCPLCIVSQINLIRNPSRSCIGLVVAEEGLQ